MAVPDIARDYQRRQKSIIAAVVAAVLAIWRGLNRDALTQSWNDGAGRSLAEAVARGQLLAAREAPRYLGDLARAQGIAADASRLVPTALAGAASAGRPLASLLYLPIIAFKRSLSSGMPAEQAIAQATAFLAAITATQVADAGRQAVNVGMAATRQWVMYVRVVNLPACGRCIILAGRTYSWSTGFQRHNMCDCSMIPWREEDDLPETPDQLFARMSKEDQDRRFGKAGAEALRLGADMGQVVNARRGMRTATVFGRDVKITSEGTTVRGHAGRRMAERGAQTVRQAEELATRYTRQGPELRRVHRQRVKTPRLMPEEILKAAKGDRDEAIRLLERFGYLDKPQAT